MTEQDLAPRGEWIPVCDFADIGPDLGVCAAVGKRQVAVFNVDGAVYALNNFDPASNANVLSRGILGDLGGELVVASPLYKQHFSLLTGRCIEDEHFSVETYAARVIDGVVWLKSAANPHGSSDSRRRLVVVGNGMAGMRTLEELLKVAPDLYDIQVFGAEASGNYNRILLSPVLAGEKTVEEIMLHPARWYHERGVRLHLGDAIVSIDRRARRVTSASGIEAAYDRLLLATGSLPTVVPVPGNGLTGVVTFRDLTDVDAMVAASRTHRQAVVIGGGLLGLEAANALQARGMSVTVAHLHERLMERQLDAAASQLLRRSLEARGLRFKMAARTRAMRGEQRVTAVEFEDGDTLAADLVVMAIGVKPNIALAQAAHLRCERGVLVDDTMLTFDPSIYAVGECVQHRKTTFGLVAPLWEQARVCAAHLGEIGLSRYVAAPTATNLKVTGINLFSAGSLQESHCSESLVFNDARRGVYKRLIVEDDQVRGAVLYGDTSDGPYYMEMMIAGRRIGALRGDLLLGAPRGAA